MLIILRSDRDMNHMPVLHTRPLCVWYYPMTSMSIALGLDIAHIC